MASGSWEGDIVPEAGGVRVLWAMQRWTLDDALMLLGDKSWAVAEGPEGGCVVFT